MSTQASDSYRNRVAVVTGTRTGLGRALAEHLLSRGATVVGLSRGEATIVHPGYSHQRVDIGVDQQVRAAMIEIGRQHGRLDILINSAAVLTSQHALVMPTERVEEMVRTNLLGGFFVAREAAKLMRRNKFGRIVNIGSMASSLEPVGDSIYAATKAATITLAGVLAKEFAGYGITVNTVAVSALDSDMLRQLPPDRVAEVVAVLPLPRMATIADITNVVDFFADSASSYITAQTIFLGGVRG